MSNLTSTDIHLKTVKALNLMFTKHDVAKKTCYSGFQTTPMWWCVLNTDIYLNKLKDGVFVVIQRDMKSTFKSKLFQ